MRQFYFSKNKWTYLGPLGLALLIGLSDVSSLNARSILEINPLFERKSLSRQPASTKNEILQFDCKNLQKNTELEFKTPLETVRLEAKNCPQNLTIKNTKHNYNLSAFPTDKSTYSSEYAYLLKGENLFQIGFASKSYSIKITRF